MTKKRFLILALGIILGLNSCFAAAVGAGAAAVGYYCGSTSKCK